MITAPDPTREQLARAAKAERLNCVAAVLFFVTLTILGILEIVRGKADLPFFGYILIAVGAGYLFVLWRSVRRYKELVQEASG